MNPYDIKRKLQLGKALKNNDFDTLRQMLKEQPLVVNVPIMVDGQAQPDHTTAFAEQAIAATSVSDDYTIMQVLRHFGIERHAVTFTLPHSTPSVDDLSTTIHNIATAISYDGDIRIVNNVGLRLT